MALAALVIVLLAGTIGAYAYDSSQSNQIVEGVKVAGVDVGGMDADEARAALRRQLVRPLDRPVTVRHDGVKYRLSADRLEISADLDAMVDAALAASRDGTLPERVWRYATNSEVDTRVPPEISYSEEAVDEFVAKVAGEIDRDPVDASVEPGPSSLGLVEGQAGRKVESGKLRERVLDAALSSDGRRVKAPVQRVQPEVTKDDLAQQYPTYLTVDRTSFELRLWKNLELEKNYTIAVGQAGYDTPTGVYTVQNKAVNPAWHVPNSDWAGELAGQVIPPGPDNPIKSRWMGIYDGAGIHGTDDLGSLGSAASRGCIRMAIPEVQELYERVGVGTPIFIGG
jgi:hypothetical protein